MEYKNRAKNRKIKRIVSTFIEGIKFKGINLQVEGKIAIFGVLVTLFSLFLNWVDSGDGSVVGSAFSSLAGSCGYLIFVLVFLSGLTVLSYSKKEKLKMSMDMHFQDHNIMLTSGGLIMMFCITTLRFVSGLQTLSSGIIYGKGPIVGIIGGFLIIIGGILMKKRKMEKSKGVFISEVAESDEEISKENNMKLPF